jgi:hypothetical protein
LAFRSDTTGVKFSNNGTVWSNFTPVGAETSSISAGGLFAWNGTLWCCVTNDGKAFTSTDGTNWTKGNRSESVYVIPNNLVFFEGAFYCLSQTPASTVGNPYNLSFIEKSVDGINWQTTIVDLALFDETPTLISGLV